MQSRVVGQMESWRGGVRRVGREARGWFTAAWRTDTSPAGTGVIHAESGSRPPVRDDGAAEKRRTARGAGGAEQTAGDTVVREFSSVGEPGRQRAGGPDQQVTVPEQNRVPSWLQTAA